MFWLMGLISVVFLIQGLWWRSWDPLDDRFPPSTSLYNPDSFLHHNFPCYLKISVKLLLLSFPFTCPKELLDISLRALYIKTLCLCFVLLSEHLIYFSVFVVASQYIPFILQDPFLWYIQNFVVNLKPQLLQTPGIRDLQMCCSSVLSWECIKLLMELYLDSTEAQKWKFWSGVFRIWGQPFFFGADFV